MFFVCSVRAEIFYFQTKKNIVIYKRIKIRVKNYVVCNFSYFVRHCLYFIGPYYSRPKREKQFRDRSLRRRITTLIWYKWRTRSISKNNLGFGRYLHGWIFDALTCKDT